MKCYTFSGGQVSEGIAITRDPLFDSVVLLGKESNEEGVKKVLLLAKDPPDIQDRQIKEAHPVRVIANPHTEKEDTFYALQNPSPFNSDERVLVRINTLWAYSLYRIKNGRWVVLNGNPQDIIVGYGTYKGGNGQSGIWQDGLVLFSAGDAVRVELEGGTDPIAYILFCSCKDDLRCMLPEEYEKMAVLRNLENAHVEPL